MVAFGLGIEPQLMKGFLSIVRSLYDAFVGSDASLAEINPLILTGDDRWLALDSKVTLDDNALYRHPAFDELRDANEEDQTETKARANGISFVKLDGDIGCVVNGAGLAMATMDAVKQQGGEPANFLDVGGGASADQVAMALELVLADPAVTAILFNIFGCQSGGPASARASTLISAGDAPAGVARLDVTAHRQPRPGWFPSALPEAGDNGSPPRHRPGPSRRRRHGFQGDRHRRA